MRLPAVACATLLIALPWRADAHRLDEYLQATRVSIAADGVRVELDLSPGVAVAADVVGAIDLDRDGHIGDREADAYAADVLRGVSVTVDGRATPLRLQQRAFADVADMREGIGTIRLTAAAPLAVAAGRHRLTLVNANAPAIGVFLANALTPADARITLGTQRRDPLQRTFSVDYDVAGDAAAMAWGVAALGMLGLLVAGRRHHRPVRPGARAPASAG
jgi:hypothetical protein